MKPRLNNHASSPRSYTHRIFDQWSTTRHAKISTPCTHPRCNLYVSAGLNRGTVPGNSLFYPVYNIFNHDGQHTYYIDHTLANIQLSRMTLASLTFIPDKQIMIITTATILTIIRTHPSHIITSLLNNLRSQHSYPHKTPKQSTFLPAKTLLLTHSRQRNNNITDTSAWLPSALVQHDPTKKIISRMCEQFNLLRSTRIRSSSTRGSTTFCGACGHPTDTTHTHVTWSICVVYVLLHQNKFHQRWNGIQVATMLTPPIQAHRSIHSSSPIHDVTPPPRRKDRQSTVTQIVCTISQPTISLSLTLHIIRAIDTLLQKANGPNTGANVRLLHPTMALLLTHLCRLYTQLQPAYTYNLSPRSIYHHILISTMSSLIPRNRF